MWCSPLCYAAECRRTDCVLLWRLGIRADEDVLGPVIDYRLAPQPDVSLPFAPGETNHIPQTSA